MPKLLLSMSIILISGCSVMTANQVRPEAESIRIYGDFEMLKECRYITEVIGTQGQWYDFLFISNKNLVLGAINDMKNQARDVGANVINVELDMLFQSSVTLFGQAYECKL